MTPTTNSDRKRGANPHSNNERNNEKKGRLKDPPPNAPAKHDDDQQKHRLSVEKNLKLAQFGGYNMFHFIDDQGLPYHVYYVTVREEGEGKEEKILHHVQ
eukprot:jgi/Psemu1/10404/gm1.10404_g